MVTALDDRTAELFDLFEGALWLNINAYSETFRDGFKTNLGARDV